MAVAILGTEAVMRRGFIVNCSAAVLEHHARVEHFGHLGVGACMAGDSVLGAKPWMQAGSELGYGVTIPSEAVVKPGEAVDAMTNKYKNEKTENLDSGLRTLLMTKHNFTLWVML